MKVPSPQPGGLAMGGEAPRESGFDGKQGLIAGILQDWGNRNSTLGWCTQGLVCTKTQGKSSDFIGDRDRTTCQYWSVSSRVGGRLWLIAGTKILAAVLFWSTHWCEPSWRPPFSHQNLDPPYSL